MTGSISLPSSDGNNRGGIKQSWNQARLWFDKNWNGEEETTPLLYNERGTAEDRNQQARRKRTAFRLIVTAVALAVVLALFGVSFGLWHSKRHTQKPDPSSPGLTQAEKIMLNSPSRDNLRNYLKTYTLEAHLAGTPNDKKQAEWTKNQFESFGLETKIDTYWPLLNYPISHRLALVSGPKHLRFEAKLTEDPVDEDETSRDPNVVPLFHGYSKNGTVQGRIVYANYGRLQDFQFLKDQGIDLNGTIALMRYGGNFRGLKVRAAETFGCAGALIYSDPIDDGPLNKDNSSNPAESYPNGPWRSKSSAQRGSVQYFSVIAGDPLTPGYPATENATRIKYEDSPGVPKIPSLPLSWEDALPILKATQGLGVRGKSDWAGGLEEVDYFSGPTEGEAVLVNHIENKITPIWNVIARIEGAQEPDKAIILGNHRDAWVYGGVDPSSGSASLMELARIFGELLKTGWRPRRTIILASWDAEEYGLVGSTEWVEDNAEWLDKEAAVYVNVDTAVSGSHFGVQASPSLNRLLYEVTAEIHDPRTGKSVFDAWRADQKLVDNEKPMVYRLGSGSDFAPFIDHAGIASMNFAFRGDYGVYHSNYDSFRWMEKFGDPGFFYHQALVKLWGLLALRLSDSPVLPLYLNDYSAEIQKYVVEITDLAAPQTFPELEVAVNKLQSITGDFEEHRQSVEKLISTYESLDDIPPKLANNLKKVNDRLAFFERGFIDPKGNIDRDFFKHVIFAPGLWQGYAAQIFPAIADGVENNNPKQVRQAGKRAAWAIEQTRKSLYEN
ncbi:Vacuolar protein sorting-associated protein 70 [Mucor circinelloides]